VTAASGTSSRWTGLHLTRRLIALAAPEWRGMALLYALMLILLVLDLSLPRVLGSIVGALAAGGAGLPWTGILLFLGISLVRNLLRAGEGIGLARVSTAILARLRANLLARVQGLGFAYHDRMRAGELISRASRDVERIGPFFADVAFASLELVLVLAGAAIMIALIDPWLGAGAGLACVLYLYLVARYAIPLRKIWEDAGDQYDTVTSAVQESVAGIRVVKTFGAGGREIDRFNRRIDVFRDQCIAGELFWTLRAPFAQFVFQMALPLVLVWGGARVIRGELAIGALATVIFYLGEMNNRMRIVSRVVQGLENALASATRVFEVLDASGALPEPASPKLPPAREGRIELAGVSFEYASEQPALHSIDLTVAPGETVAVVGPTGSGKSTLMALLPRFYDATAGSIRLDGVDLREWPLAELRRRIGLVFQETFLFSATVAENVAFGRPEATREEIERAARIAQAHDFVLALPLGYDTLIGERGVNLSGGQRQRLAIARAVLANPEVLLLDDALSSVDSHTEVALQKAIAGAARGRTTVIIAQRLSTVLHAHRVVVLNEGRILAQGTHDALLADCPLYAELFRGQWVEDEPCR